jgi:hypothetical protein
MKKGLFFTSLATALLAATTLPAVSQTTDDTAKAPADRARVFITDSQSWEVGSHSGGGGALSPARGTAAPAPRLRKS